MRPRRILRPTQPHLKKTNLATAAGLPPVPVVSRRVPLYLYRDRL